MYGSIRPYYYVHMWTGEVVEKSINQVVVVNLFASLFFNSTGRWAC